MGMSTCPVSGFSTDVRSSAQTNWKDSSLELTTTVVWASLIKMKNEEPQCHTVAANTAMCLVMLTTMLPGDVTRYVGGKHRTNDVADRTSTRSPMFALRGAETLSY